MTVCIHWALLAILLIGYSGSILAALLIVAGQDGVGPVKMTGIKRSARRGAFPQLSRLNPNIIIHA
jgi:hypothetical protein